MKDKEVSVFEVLGPVMVGPSSSHTAGACRLALWARQLADDDVAACTFTLYGSFAHTYRGHGTDRALLGGILGLDMDDPRLKDAYELADAAGVRYQVIADKETMKPHPNTVHFSMTGHDGRRTEVEGKSVGGGAAVITAIDGIEVEFSGAYNTLVVHQLDKPGIVAWMTTCLSEAGVNIAFMKLFREDRGSRAFTIVEADEDIPREVVDRIVSHPYVKEAKLLETMQSAARRRERPDGAESDGSQPDGSRPDGADEGSSAADEAVDTGKSPTAPPATTPAGPLPIDDATDRGDVKESDDGTGADPCGKEPATC